MGKTFSLEELKMPDIDNFSCEGLQFRSSGKIYLGMTESVCPICGKKYTRTSQHGWKVGTSSSAIYFCSYSCMRKEETRKELRRKQKEEAARKRDLKIVANADRKDLSPREKQKIKNAFARLERAAQKRGQLT